MKLYLGSDHAGWELKNMLKNWLLAKNMLIKDLGCYNNQSVDYPDIAKLVVEKVVSNASNKGLLVCGTGIGMCISANRFRGIYAANCCSVYSAKMSKQHNNSNILTLGARILTSQQAKEILQAWLETEFAAGRHAARIKKMELS